MSYSPDGQTLASASEDKTVRLWDAKTGQELRVLKRHTKEVMSVSYSPDGQTLASASLDKTVRLWDAKTGQQLRVLKGHTDFVYSVSYSPDGQTVASGSFDNTVRLWDAKTGQQLRVLKGRTEAPLGLLWGAAVTSVSYSPDGQSLASAISDHTVRLWDAKTGQQLRVLKGHSADVTSVSYSPDGQTLASASVDKTVRLWDAKTGQERRVLKGHTAQVMSVSYSPDGQTLASASHDQTVRLWDAKTGQELRVLKGHTGWILSVNYSPDGQTLASASYDQTVRLWDAKTGQELRVLKGHTDPIVSLSYSPDGQTLASASYDKTVRLWDVRTGQDRSLTPAELSYRRWVTSPDLQWHKDQVEQYQKTDPAAAAFHLGWYVAALDYYAAQKEQPAAPPSLHSAILSRGRLYAGVLQKTAGPALTPLLAEAARDAALENAPWQSHALYGAALYRAGDAPKAKEELTLALKQRGQHNVLLAAFLAMTHAQLGANDQAKEWLTKLAPPKDAPWEEQALAALLRPEVEAAVRDGKGAMNRL